MNATHAMRYGVTPWSLTITCVVLLATAALGWHAWRRSGYRPAQGWLEALRFGIMAMGVWMLNQPELVREYIPLEKPTLAVLWDDSPSMRTRDAKGEASGGADWSTRQEAIAKLIDPQSWTTLDSKFNLVLEPLGSENSGGHSNLHAPLEALSKSHPRLRGIVLISDGDWNDGPPPVDAATRMRLRGVPIYTVPVGSATRLPDVELVSLDAPTFGVAGKSVRVPFVIESSLPREQTITATLRSSSGETVQEEVVLAPMAKTATAIVWKPSAVGDVTLEVELSPHPGETQRDNNTLSAPIVIRKEQLHVLLVESVPRWEYRYLRNALSRDPGIQLSCMLFQPGLGKPGGGNKDYIPRFPESLEALAKFDVIFLGDVGIDGAQLTTEQCHWIKGVVQHQATGLVCMPGLQGRQLSLLETELNELYPVVLDPSQPGGWGSRTAGHFELTQQGRHSLLTKLADGDEENFSVWESLPGFQWYAAVERARPGTETLCVHADAMNQFGRLPLLVTRTFGTGKVLFMGTDGAWRWRKGVEDKYHYRFWGQVVRWMAYQRNMSQGETMRLFFSPDQPHLRQTLALHANVMEANGEPLQRGEVRARIVAPSGKTETTRFQSTGDEWGAFEGTYTTREPGRHTVTLSCQETDGSLESSFFVQGIADERPGKAARPEVLEEIAQVTEAAVLDPRQVELAVQTLASLPDPPPSVRRIPLWSHPITAGIIVALLGCFWIFRKMVGLI